MANYFFGSKIGDIALHSYTCHPLIPNKERSGEDGEALFDFSSHIQTLFHRAESL
jgi:hypothetical protein